MIQAETLELLEWPRLCQHLSTFAATKLGVLAAKHLPLPETREESSILLDRTREIYQLELGTEGGLSFEGIEDIGDALERAKIGGRIAGKALLEIATTLAGVRRLRRAIDAKEEKLPTLAALVEQVKTHPELEQEIHHCIDDRGQVTDRASPKLAEIRRQMKSVRDRIYQILQNILQRHSNAVQEQTITQRGDRFVIPVKAPQKDAIPGAIRDSSSTGATLYIEPNAIVGAGNQLHQLRGQEKREEEAILEALSEKVAAVSEDLEHLLAIATALDLAAAKARYSLWLEANPPHFIDQERGREGEGESNRLAETEEQKPITLRRLRHPLLVWQQKHEQGREVIPIDVQIPSKIRVVAITGPNTGGKTVALKTLALAALMAKVGLFVPAKEPVELPWFDRILADIGDEQSLQQSLSTFSGHIRRISRIMAEIEENPQSLVLLDEVGAGTDPAEGSALAIALLEALAERALITIATTHYGELKALKYRDERFENASVEFDEESLQPTYRLLWGIPGRSNALAIARRLGLGEEVVEAARERVGGFSEEINQTIAGLEQQRKQQETRAKEAEQLLQRTEQFYKEVSQKAAELREREEALKRSQEQAVNNAVSGARSEIAKVIRQLQQGPQTNREAERAQAAVAEIAKVHLPKREPKPEKPSYMPQVGERIRLPKLGQTAEVLAVETAENEATVRFGIMKMTIPLADIESLDGQKVEPPKAKAPPPPPAPPKAGPIIRTSNNTIDIRGSRVNDAEVEIERAIAKAVGAGSGALWVLHGKGTGRLREGVHAFLQQHPQVERFELAPQNEGGAGVTVAYLL
ncbi:endonuclease MutS2 [Oscillatoria sp. FACHB-1406]|uniref:endonuclease MutS2 n=1 Tax=Oscillatoria sp. FACHB-1406 TaxID=2692846 RepID=UPI0016886401|nr:endonuclease MutS2 [Oscillatoria sp. FACHB-1406]MBD2577161.1 endonuclease MutS2 [Oscillatoria sp. FACHB-1406]